MPKMSMKSAIMAFSVLAVLGPLGACVSTATEDETTEIPGYKRTGETESCLSIARIRELKALDEEHLLVKTGSDVYVNDLGGRCNGAGRPSTHLQYSTSLTQLCRNEIIDVVDTSTGFTTGSCGIGTYEKLEKVAKDEMPGGGQ